MLGSENQRQTERAADLVEGVRVEGLPIPVEVLADAALSYPGFLGQPVDGPLAGFKLAADYYTIVLHGEIVDGGIVDVNWRSADGVPGVTGGIPELS